MNTLNDQSRLTPSQFREFMQSPLSTYFPTKKKEVKPDPPKMVYASQCSQKLLRELTKEVIAHPEYKKDPDVAYVLQKVKNRGLIAGGNDRIAQVLNKLKGTTDKREEPVDNRVIPEINVNHHLRHPMLPDEANGDPLWNERPPIPPLSI